MVRRGGFADAELYFNGKTLALFRRDQNIYSKADIPGSVENLVGELRDKYQRPLPAADLLSANVYEAMMPDVKDVKDLGTGFIRGIECDHIAFRTDEVDWQLWIARGDRPYPVRLIVTSKKVAGSPVSGRRHEFQNRWPGHDRGLQFRAAAGRQAGSAIGTEEL